MKTEVDRNGVGTKCKLDIRLNAIISPAASHAKRLHHAEPVFEFRRFSLSFSLFASSLSIKRIDVYVQSWHAKNNRPTYCERARGMIEKQPVMPVLSFRRDSPADNYRKRKIFTMYTCTKYLGTPGIIALPVNRGFSKGCG